MAGLQTQPNEKTRLANHSFHLEGRKRAQITGVSDVLSFHENEIVLKVESGLMILGGEELHIGKLLLDEGRLDVVGQVDSVVYEAPNANVKKVFRWIGKKER